MSRFEWNAGDGFGFGDLFELRDERFHFRDRDAAETAGHVRRACREQRGPLFAFAGKQRELGDESVYGSA
jgi:hypothetical protein